MALSTSKSATPTSPPRSGVFATTADPLTPDGMGFPPIYEASVLYAANNVSAAHDVLKAYLKTPEGRGSARAWLMLFDLYQLTDNQADFEQLAMLFTVTFERSPPLWNEAMQACEPRRTEKRVRVDFFQFMPAGDGALLSEIDRLEPFATSMGSCRIDFTKVRTILAGEAELFSIILHRLARANIPIWFNGLTEFAALLKQRLNDSPSGTAGALADSQGYWSLLFELLIVDGRPDEYEAIGLEYAVAFERSPPAWFSITRPPAQVEPDTEAPAVVSSAAGFPLKGVLGANSLTMLHELALHAQAKQEVLVDMSAVMRIDFNAITLFLEALRVMHTAQKRVILANANELVAALLEVFAANKHAIIMRKKAA